MIIHSTEYYVLHEWIRNNFKSDKSCEFCKKDALKLEWACMDGKYNKNRKSYKHLCISCHRKFDAVGNFTHCKRGHLRIKNNIYIRPNSRTECYPCKKLLKKKWELERALKSPLIKELSE